MNYKLICFTFTILASCDYRASKYRIATENWDGPRCETFEYKDYKTVEIAKCKETGIYLMSFNNKRIQYSNYLKYEAIAIYEEKETDLRVFERSDFIDKIFSQAAKSGKIKQIYISDSTIDIITDNNNDDHIVNRFKL